MTRTQSPINANLLPPQRKRGGYPKFVPTENQRTWVKMCCAYGVPIENQCKGVINPITDKPITPSVFAKAFAMELITGPMEYDSMVMAALTTQIKKGNMTAIIWYTRHRWGWDNDMFGKRRQNPDDIPGPMRLQIEGGLPDEPREDDDIPGIDKADAAARQAIAEGAGVIEGTATEVNGNGHG